MEVDYILLDWKTAGAAPEMEFEFSQRTWITQSGSCPEVLHRLHLLRDGRGFCTCEDFRYRGRKTGKPCKHLIALDKYMKVKARQKQNIKAPYRGWNGCLNPSTSNTNPAVST